MTVRKSQFFFWAAVGAVDLFFVVHALLPKLEVQPWPWITFIGLMSAFALVSFHVEHAPKREYDGRRTWV